MKAFLDALEHPLKRELLTVRKAILAISPKVTEGIKWNAPSFRLKDDFATFHLRGPGLTLVLHSGARSKLKLASVIDDPSEILEWRGADRALVTFANAAEVKKKLPALKRVLRAWVRQVQ